MILLDTDICIEILRGNEKVIQKRLETDETIAVSFMTVGELYYGAQKSKHPSKNIHLIENFIFSVDVINSDLQILKKFGDLKISLELTGFRIPDADLLIASTCLTKCKKLITRNVKHFKRIDELIVDNWVS
jgi:tRNA(fMet)-specific endonuclease VapC